MLVCASAGSANVLPLACAPILLAILHKGAYKGLVVLNVDRHLLKRRAWVPCLGLGVVVAIKCSCCLGVGGSLHVCRYST